MSAWKDITSHSKGSDRSEVKSVEAYIGKSRLIVTKHIHYAPDEWTAVLDGVFTRRIVSKGSLQDAKEKALILADQILKEMLSQVSELSK